MSPAISEETIDFHHDRHQRAYVERLNHLLTGSDYEGMRLDALIESMSGASPDDRWRQDVANAACEAWNHQFYWLSLSPEPMLPGPGLLRRMEQDFGGLEATRQAFVAMAMGHFASGWLWLVKDPASSGKLGWLALPDAGSARSRGLIPLLACDLWEHAYYIDYRNSKRRYLGAVWSRFNWAFAEENLALDQAPDLSSAFEGTVELLASQFSGLRSGETV